MLFHDVKDSRSCYIKRIRQHPIKANPAKAGDAKPWVYSHHIVTRTARPPKITIKFVRIGLAATARFFYSDGMSTFEKVRFTNADRQKPVRNKKEYCHVT